MAVSNVKKNVKNLTNNESKLLNNKLFNNYKSINHDNETREIP